MLEKTLESPLDCKEIQLVHFKEDHRMTLHRLAEILTQHVHVGMHAYMCNERSACICRVALEGCGDGH